MNIYLHFVHEKETGVNLLVTGISWRTSYRTLSYICLQLITAHSAAIEPCLSNFSPSNPILHTQPAERLYCYSERLYYYSESNTSSYSRSRTDFRTWELSQYSTFLARPTVRAAQRAPPSSLGNCALRSISAC
jgi:hypothetical protein